MLIHEEQIDEPAVARPLAAAEHDNVWLITDGRLRRDRPIGERKDVVA